MAWGALDYVLGWAVGLEFSQAVGQMVGPAVGQPDGRADAWYSVRSRSGGWLPVGLVFSQTVGWSVCQAVGRAGCRASGLAAGRQLVGPLVGSSVEQLVWLLVGN